MPTKADLRIARWLAKLDRLAARPSTTAEGEAARAATARLRAAYPHVRSLPALPAWLLGRVEHMQAAVAAAPGDDRPKMLHRAACQIRGLRADSKIEHGELMLALEELRHTARESGLGSWATELALGRAMKRQAMPTML